ncbi:hypothetical protein [Lignipirellula cremea]|nr:hypothetical protein [Lignipirellula cremea]
MADQSLATSAACGKELCGRLDCGWEICSDEGVSIFRPDFQLVENGVMAKLNGSLTKAAELSPEQQERADLILQHLRANADKHLVELSVLLASKPDSQIFGKTEFEARDIVHRIGAQAIQAAVDAAAKKGVPGC